jgi:hypothetical protein
MARFLSFAAPGVPYSLEDVRRLLKNLLSRQDMIMPGKSQRSFWPAAHKTLQTVETGGLCRYNDL